MSDEKPVPCPVCGKEPALRLFEEARTFVVWCHVGYHWNGHDFRIAAPDREEAIARWNRAFSREGRDNE